jgi:hypothetical protein
MKNLLIIQNKPETTCGWVDVKAVLWSAYSNQKLEKERGLPNIG